MTDYCILAVLLAVLHARVAQTIRFEDSDIDTVRDEELVATPQEEVSAGSQEECPKIIVGEFQHSAIVAALAKINELAGTANLWERWPPPKLVKELINPNKRETAKRKHMHMLHSMWCSLKESVPVIQDVAKAHTNELMETYTNSAGAKDELSINTLQTNASQEPHFAKRKVSGGNRAHVGHGRDAESDGNWTSFFETGPSIHEYLRSALKEAKSAQQMEEYVEVAGNKDGRESRRSRPIKHKFSMFHKSKKKSRSETWTFKTASEAWNRVAFFLGLAGRDLLMLPPDTTIDAWLVEDYDDVMASVRRLKSNLEETKKTKKRPRK